MTRVKAWSQFTDRTSSPKPRPRRGKTAKGASGSRLVHSFAGVGERDSSIRSRARERSSTSLGAKPGDEERPSNHPRSRGIHPEGFGRRSTGKPVRATLMGRRLATTPRRFSKERRYLERENAWSRRHPRDGAISGRPSREMRSEPAQAGRFSRVAGNARPFTWSGNALRGEVEGDARSGGVPKNSVECKKPREQGEEDPGKGSSAPRARLDGLWATRNAPRDLRVEVARKR